MARATSDASNRGAEDGALALPREAALATLALSASKACWSPALAAVRGCGWGRFLPADEVLSITVLGAWDDDEEEEADADTDIDADEDEAVPDAGPSPAADERPMCMF